jgi:hypothetical protein
LWDGNEVGAALAHYTETSGVTTTLLQSFDTTSPSIHIAWDVFGSGSYTNVSGSHQELTLPRLGKSFVQPAGTTVYLSVDIKGGSLSEVYFAVHNSTYWFDVIKFQGLGADWVSFTWSFTIPQTTGTCVFGVGYIPTAIGTNLNYTNQSSGTVLIRDLHIFVSGDLATISAPLVCQDVTVQSLEAQHGYIVNGITAANYFSSSDRALKSDIEDASLQSCQEVFDAVEVKTYERTDLAPGKRVGFIAQDIQQSLPAEFANLVGTRPETAGAGELLTLDYSRLVCVLWGVVKNLSSRLEALEEQKPAD